MKLFLIASVSLLMFSCGESSDTSKLDSTPVVPSQPSNSDATTNGRADSVSVSHEVKDSLVKRQGWWKITKNGDLNTTDPTVDVISEGLYVDNMKKGLWRFYNPDGSLQKLISYSKDGKEFFCPLTRAQADSSGRLNYVDENGKPQGWWVITGKMANINATDKPYQEGLYVDGNKEGLWKVYNDDGSVKASATFVKNVKQK